MLFTCKQHPRITDGPKHLFLHLAQPHQPVNNIARKKAVEEILKLRINADIGVDKPRLYEVPHLRFQVKSYTLMIELKTKNVSEPILTVNICQAELLSLKDSPHVLPRYQEADT